MAGHRALKASQLRSAAKENQPPKKSKRTVSVVGLFSQQHRLRQKHDDVGRDVLAPRTAGLSKSIKARADSFSQYLGSKKADPYSLNSSFANATRVYREGLTECRGQRLQPIYNELIARVDGLDVNGNRLEDAGISMKTQVNALAQESSALSKPIGEEEITLQIERESGVIESENIKLKDTIHGFRKLTDQTRAKLMHYLQELQDIDAEIAAAKQAVVQTEDGEVKKAKEDYKAELVALGEEARACKQQTLAEVSQSRKQDKAWNLETNRKVEEFMKALQ